MTLRQSSWTTWWCDNQEANALVDHPTNHGSTKHIDVSYHFLRDRMKLGQIVVQYVETSENIADVFTKPWELLGLWVSLMSRACLDPSHCVPTRE